MAHQYGAEPAAIPVREKWDVPVEKRSGDCPIAKNRINNISDYIVT